MLDGNVSKFIDKITFQEEAVLYNGKNFFHGLIYNPNKQIYSFEIHLWDKNDHYIEKHSTVAMGPHGCIKKLANRAFFEKGLAEMVKQLQPKTIIVYGAAPDYIFDKYKEKGIQIIQFDSGYAVTHKAVSA